MLSAVVLLLLLSTAPAFAQAAGAAGRFTGGQGSARDTAGWHFELVPYLWASGVEGRVGVRGRTLDMDASIQDLLQHLSGALTFASGARHGRWGIGTEVIWIRLSNQRGTPGPLFSSAKMGASQLILELTGRYRIIDAAPVTAELLLGGRYWHLNNSLTLDSGVVPGIDLEATQSWFDPILGVSGAMDLSRTWLVQARGDLGGFSVGSDFTWQLLGLVGYRLHRTITVLAGYRHLDVDFVQERKEFIYDIGTGGPIMGVMFRP